MWLRIRHPWIAVIRGSTQQRPLGAAATALADAGDAAPRPAPAPAPEVPAELTALLAADPSLAAAFAALTPGRQRSHILHIAGAAQPATRAMAKIGV